MPPGQHAWFTVRMVARGTRPNPSRFEPPGGTSTFEHCGAACTTGGVLDGRRCTLAKGYQTGHPGFGQCRFHGGLTLAGKKAAAREMGRHLANTAYSDRFGGQPVDNATAEELLLEEVRRSAGMVRFLEERVAKFRTGALDEENAGLPLLTIDGKGTDVAAWLLMYREERKHLVLVSRVALDAGLSKRLVELAENQGAMLVGVLQQTFEAVGLTDIQAAKAREVLPGLLREAGRLVRGELANQ